MNLPSQRLHFHGWSKHSGSHSQSSASLAGKSQPHVAHLGQSRRAQAQMNRDAGNSSSSSSPSHPVTPSKQHDPSGLDTVPSRSGPEDSSNRLVYGRPMVSHSFNQQASYPSGFKTWIDSDESESEADQSIEPLRLPGCPSTSSNENPKEHAADDSDIDVPLSKLSRRGLQNRSISSNPGQPPLSHSSRPSSNDSGIISKVISHCSSSSRSLRSLVKRHARVAPAGQPPATPPSLSSSTSPASPTSSASSHVPPSVSSNHPARLGLVQEKRLRPVASSPDLSRLASHGLTMPPLPSLPSSLFPAPPPSLHGAPTPGGSKFLDRCPGGNSYPGSHIGSHRSQSSVSPPKSYGLRSAQSSSSLRSQHRSKESEIYNRMKKRHQLDLLEQYSSLPRVPPPPSVPLSNMSTNIMSNHQSMNSAAVIEPGLFSMLNEAQQAALWQRSQFLVQNMKVQLDSFAREMALSNLSSSHQRPAHIPPAGLPNPFHPFHQLPTYGHVISRTAM